MVKPRYETLQRVIERALHGAEAIKSNPGGAHYYVGTSSSETGYLKQLDILGAPKRVKRKELGIRNNAEYWITVYEVNYKRLEHCLDTLDKIAKDRSLHKLRVDLDEFR